MPRKKGKKAQAPPDGSEQRALPVGMTAPPGRSQQRALPVGMAAPPGRSQQRALPVGMAVPPGRSQQRALPVGMAAPPGRSQQTEQTESPDRRLQSPTSDMSHLSLEYESDEPFLGGRAKVKSRKVSPERFGFEYRKKTELIPLPVKPGFNKLGKSIRLITNCYSLKIPSGNVYHYDIEIYNQAKMSTTTSKEKMKKEEKKHRCLNTKCNRMVFDEMLKKDERFRGLFPVYDGRKNMYTRNRLEITAPVKSKVVLTDPSSGSKDEVFWVCIRPVEKEDTNDCAISLDPLHALFQGEVSSVPRETIMAIETVLKHSPSLRFTPFGQSFFYPPKNPHPLGKCKEIWFGHHQSVRLGQAKPMVNLDISASTFYRREPLLNYFAAYLSGGDVDGLHRVTSINEDSLSTLLGLLKNLQIEVTHLRGYRRKYRIVRIAGQNATRLEFERDLNGAKVRTTIALYFAQHHHRKLEFPHLPCLQVHPVDKNIFLPIEVCEVIEGQRYNGLLHGEETTQMVKDTSLPPRRRFEEIKHIHNRAEFKLDPYLQKFGFSVNTEPVRVEGRILNAPTITYHKSSADSVVKPFKGSWDMRNKKFLEGAKVHSWALLSYARLPDPVLNKFADDLSTFASKHNLHLGARKTTCVRNVPLNVKEFDHYVEGVFRDLKDKFQVDLVVVVIPDPGPRHRNEKGEDKTKVLYRSVKDVATKEDIVSQCVTEKNVKRSNPSLVSNILLKINAKMGGTNNSLTFGEMPDFMKDNVMFVGADVTHPSPTEDIPCSIAAVVGSVSREYSVYEVVARAQINEAESKISREVIVDMSSIMVELLRAYKIKNKNLWPSKIIVFRDGVSEGEFAHVQKMEVEKIQEACRLVEKGYNPKITYIVMQKRHHVRTMPEDSREAMGPMGNPPPGTLIDTVITHPRNFDFYLYGHFGLQGTSRPAYFTVVKVAEDEKKKEAISETDMHKMCYYLCHIYARSTKSISSPAPARYADDAAFRARQILLKYKNAQPQARGSKKLDKSDLRAINQDLKGLKFSDIL